MMLLLWAWQVEGTCHGKYGYVIAVTNMISKGQVRQCV